MADYAPIATIRLLYNNRNITQDIAAGLLSFTYTDKVQGESDELQVTIEDVNKLWMHEWYPEKGAILNAEISYKGRTLPCGTFSIDEMELAGPPDVVSIRALAAFVTKKIRTRHSSAHENKTLGEIVRTVASRHGFSVSGTIPNFRINRVTQHRQTDLQFLHGLAATYGLVFSVRDKTITFTSIYDLEAKDGVVTLERTQLSSYTIRDKTAETYKSARLLYHNSINDELISHVEQTGQETAKEDVLELRSTAENRQQAELKAKAALYQANTLQREGSISLEGNPLLIAGNNFRLTHIGAFSGMYNILESTHSIDRAGGYKTSINIKYVGSIAATLRKPQ